MGVVFHFGLIESLTTEVEEIKNNEYDQEDQDSNRRISGQAPGEQYYETIEAITYPTPTRTPSTVFVDA